MLTQVQKLVHAHVIPNNYYMYAGYHSTCKTYQGFETHIKKRLSCTMKRT